VKRLRCAVIGSGNIGADLMMKLLKREAGLQLVALAGIDPKSQGLALARSHGVATTAAGVEGLLALPEAADLDVVFDATSAAAHEDHYRRLGPLGCRVVDLTPAALGPYLVPVVNGDLVGQGANNVNMVTCGGQATVPIVSAVSKVARVRYAEIVASIASRSAGPGTRANIDEFTQTTARALEVVGGAERAKAIIILNPAEPPLMMRNTVYTFSDFADEAAIEASVSAMVEAVQAYAPGYRLKQAVQFERFGSNNPLKMPGLEPMQGLKSSVFLEVEGAGDFLPTYAGNLDIMTSAAVAVGERMAEAAL